MLNNLVTEIFVINEWVIPPICVAYGAIISKLAAGRGWDIRKLIPLGCVLIGIVSNFAIEQAVSTGRSGLQMMSDSVYDGLAGVGIYELLKNTRQFVSILKLKLHRK